MPKQPSQIVPYDLEAFYARTGTTAAWVAESIGKHQATLWRYKNQGGVDMTTNWALYGLECYLMELNRSEGK